MAVVLVATTTRVFACQSLDITTLQNEPSIQQLTFVAIDLRGGNCWESSGAEASARHPPWSTFKIPHLLMALETGAVLSPTDRLAWDSAKRPAASSWPAAWRQGQSLLSAFERSAAWYFQEVVPRIGPANYALWLGRFQYGNQEVPPNSDDFWLGGPLAISAREQARFLACVAMSGCGASPASITVLESAALSSTAGHGRLYAKTGSGPLKPGQFDGAFEGWYVGYVRDLDSRPTASFALYVRTASYGHLQRLRQEASVHLLKQLGLF